MSAGRVTRRSFLQASCGAALSGVLTPCFFPETSARAASASDKLGMGAIGVGGRGTRLALELAGYGNMLACADVDRTHAEGFVDQLGRKCEIHGDYRKLLDRQDIDLVCIGTPDHWHAKIAIDALRAGKDVYCEKPLTLTIDEGKQICRVAKQTGRVFQVGTQQRSSPLFLQAVALARSGRLGKKLTATCSVGPGHTSKVFETSDPPSSLDWDMWLGQAPKVPYCKERCHGSFRYWLEYSGGKLSDWGAHHVDIAQWAIGGELTGPKEISASGEIAIAQENFNYVEFFAGKATLPNAYNTPVGFHIDLQFANENRMHIQEGETDNGILIEGENGRIFVNRRRISGKPLEKLTAADKDWLAAEVIKLYKGRKPTTHVENFLACVRDRSQPISDVFTTHRGISSVHLGLIAILLKRKLQWDPEREDFVDDEQASALLSRPQRAPYAIDPPSSAGSGAAIAAAEPGFVSIYNGKDFDGWAGPTYAWEADQGVIRCKPKRGGTVYYKQEYGDFIVRLEYKLPEGGNNGLAIRYPGKGDTAYEGMCEIQILDDDHPKNAGHDPRKFNGSAYNMVAAERGHLKPTGQWNSMEATVRGSTIKVELNGAVILDADLSKVTEFVGNKPHPGKDRTRGYFGFAGHGSPVEFRNIRIRELP